MTPTTEITATLFEVAAYEDTIDSVIELVAARLRSKLRAAVPK